MSSDIKGELRVVAVVVQHLIGISPGRLTVEVFPEHPAEGGPQGTPRAHWRDYIFSLVWKHLSILQEELKDMSGEDILTGLSKK